MLKEIKSQKIIKSFPAFISKINKQGDLGIVGAFVAVMGNIDLGDDIIMQGAFTKTISERANKIKVLDNHNSHSVLNGLGKLLRIQEVGKESLPSELLAEFPDATGGLFVEIQFILEVESDTSAQAFRLIKHNVIDEYSIGFEIIKADFQDVETDGGTRNVRIIREIKLWEVSPVIFAMNPATTTIGSKSDENDLENKPQKPSDISPLLSDETLDADEIIEAERLAKELETPIEQKRIPDGYRVSTDEKMCGNCFFFGQVTNKRGYCTFFEEVVLFNYVSNVYKPKLKTVSQVMQESLLEFLENRITEYTALGVYDDDDERRLLEMLDSLTAMLLEMIPSDLINRPMPEMTLPKNVDEMTQSKAESGNTPLTADSRKEALSRIAEIRIRMSEESKKRRVQNGNAN